MTNRPIDADQTSAVTWPARTARGTCAFRLMPSDALAGAPSEALVTRIGEGVAVHYAWRHPSDGPQRGVVLVGGTDADSGRVEGSLFDTWHQQPGLMALEGRREGDAVLLAGTYAEEWGWEVDVVLTEDAPGLTMRNVVPASALADPPPDAPALAAGPTT